jgi:hypothetical protein
MKIEVKFEEDVGESLSELLRMKWKLEWSLTKM